MGATPVAPHLCAKCERPKEASRAKSRLCRACDGAQKARRVTGTNTAMRRLTLDLPVEVWDRLDAEAQSKGQRIAGFTQALIITRDTRKHGATPVAPESETP